MSRPERSVKSIVGDDQAGVLGKNLARHIDGRCEEQSVAMEPVIHPFLVGAEILDRGLDLDDGDHPVAGERHKVSAPARAKRHLRD